MKLVIYCLCVVAALLIHALVFGLPAGADFVVVLFPIAAVLYCVLALFLWHQKTGPGNPVGTVLAACNFFFIGYCVQYPLIWPDALADGGLRAAVLSTTLWPQIFVCLFSGIVFVQLDGLQALREGHVGRTGVAAYFAFGLAMTFAFFAGLRTVYGPAHGEALTGAARAVFGGSAIHYLIFIFFFITIAYTIHAAVGLHAPNPHGGPRRRFIKILIGTLPLLGFLGTVLGIMDALGGLPGLFLGDRTTASDLSSELAASLSGISLAFETTMLGLVTSLVATLGLSYVEKREAEAVLRRQESADDIL
ncbi:MotA/TolQ/ExbB proton channel family protein [Roseibium sp.]|uniref:MotA/TolQ/ExbB proton channel family protein n=1 Tax=Roseibium sp. TaxID=1936156 RepID=UPI0032644983